MIRIEPIEIFNAEGVSNGAKGEKFRMSPQPRPSKHRNKKTYTRKKAGKKTHRKR